jgi:hypothetical protein
MWETIDGAINVYRKSIESTLRDTRRKHPEFPSWVTTDHIIAFMLARHPDRTIFSALEFSKVAADALSVALLSGEKAADKVLKLADLSPPEKKQAAARVIPFDPAARRALQKDERDLVKIRQDIDRLRSGLRVPNLTLSGALTVERGLLAAIRAKKKLL